MKQILIIGGSGAIGSALVNEYDKKKEEMSKQKVYNHIVKTLNSIHKRLNK